MGLSTGFKGRHPQAPKLPTGVWNQSAAHRGSRDPVILAALMSLASQAMGQGH